jgi:gliding motility-associated-like protein
MRILVVRLLGMYRKLLLILLGLAPLWLHATHNRAGEITYRHLGGLLFEITITTYTDPTSVAADRCELEIKFGDGDFDTIPRVNHPTICDSSVQCECKGEILIPNVLKKNIYRTRHSYRGPGTYEITVEDPNRVDGIQNIPGSVNIPFFLRSVISISPLSGYNTSTILLYPPVDDGCVGQPYYHNPGAYDPDQDSLVYSLVKCLGANGQVVPGYVFPNQTSNGGTLTIDSRTGTLEWDSPTVAGFFNVCILISEYRKIPGTNQSVLVGEVLRDMQIAIDNCQNVPPRFKPLDDFCVNAGDPVQQEVVAYDTMGQSVTLTAVGEPFEVDSPAVFQQPITALDTVKGLFEWQTTCGHIRKLPYKVDFKAIDNYPFGPLANFESFFVTVVGPAPTNPEAEANKNTIELDWRPPSCDNAQGYNIYRRIDSSDFDPDFCEIGIPAAYGFKQIASVSGINNTTYVDDDNGNGLVHGQVYCYRIMAFYEGEVEGYTSEEICMELNKDVPVITHVTVTETGVGNGSDTVMWTHPTELDTSVEFPGPYKYIIYGSAGNAPANTPLEETDEKPRISQLDSIFFATNLNTVEFAQNFRIELVSDGQVVGSTHEAKSVFLRLGPVDNALILTWDVDVPWTNKEYVIFKERAGVFEVLDTTVFTTYIDSGLTNGKEYSYFVRSIGRYSTTGFPDPIINNSQIAKGIPVDTIPPCPPQSPEIESDCDLAQNIITWTNPNEVCSGDVIGYNIYRTPVLGDPYQLDITLPSDLDTSYVYDNLVSVAGCYMITAIDSFGNESGFSERLCVDNCPEYELPNVMTPGGDGMNDFFRPYPYRYVESIDLHVYNRWGNLVFNTTDPDINWDGKHQSNGKQLSSGVYFYECVVHEIRLNGIVPRTLRGNITILNQENINDPN